MPRAKKEVVKSEPTVPEQVREALDKVAKMMGVAVSELWGIFVRQYVVRGISELFIAAVFVVVALILSPLVGYWGLLIASPSLFFFYGAIQYLGNPKYYAIEDIMKKVQDIKGDTKDAIVRRTFQGF